MSTKEPKHPIAFDQIPVYEEVRVRRKDRSFLSPSPPSPSPSAAKKKGQTEGLKYAMAEEDHDGGEGHSVWITLKVMQTDGSKRPALSIYEWLQQYITEESALREAIGDRLPKGNRLLCQLGKEDGYDDAWTVFGDNQGGSMMGHWWTKPTLYAELIAERRGAELEARIAKVVLERVGGERGHLIAHLVKPFLVLPASESFPCKEVDLEVFCKERLGVRYYWSDKFGHDILNEYDCSLSDYGYMIAMTALYAVDFDYVHHEGVPGAGTWHPKGILSWGRFGCEWHESWG